MMYAGRCGSAAALLCGILIQLILPSVTATMLGRASVSASVPRQLLLLLHSIETQKPYQTLLIYTAAEAAAQSCPFEQLLQQKDTPVGSKPVLLINSEISSNSSYTWHWNMALLVLSCQGSLELHVTANAEIWHQLLSARRVIYAAPAGASNAQRICRAYMKRDIYNVLIVDAELEATGSYYSCRKRVAAGFVKQQLSAAPETAMFVEQFIDMQGDDIVTIVDQLAPRSMFIVKDDGVYITGYVANLVASFAERHNARYSTRYNHSLGHTLYYGDIEEHLESNQVDIAMAVSGTRSKKNLDRLSYPYLLSSYCFMLPVPRAIPYNEIYLIIVHPLVTCLLLLLMCIFSLLLICTSEPRKLKFSFWNIILNDSWRGMLAQSFPMPENPNRKLKLVIILLCFTSILTTTMYVGYLQMLLQNPPIEPRLRNIDDVEKSEITILVSRKEADNILKMRNQTTESITPNLITVIESFHDFVTTRNSFNMSYVYAVTALRWRTYKEQQKFFEHDAFYFDKDFCLEKFMLLCLPLRKDLPYRDLFNQHILRIHESGLSNHWLAMSFFDMVEADLIPLADLGPVIPVEDMIYLRDLYWIFVMYGAMIGLSCISFLVELCHFQFRRRVMHKIT